MKITSEIYKYLSPRKKIFIVLIAFFFQISCEKPERIAKISTLDYSPANISYTSAILRGELTDLGSQTIEDFGIVISQNASYLNSIPQPKDTIPSKKQFKIEFTSLLKNTTYYYKAYITVNSNTTYGTSKQFKTKDTEVATVTAGTISDITLTTATLNGEVTSDGGESVTKKGLCWGTSPNPTIANSPDTTINGSGAGTFTGLMHGLTAGTTYYARAYAINTKGTAYNSTDIVFTTQALPVATTVAANPVQNTTATLNGTVNANNLSSVVTFEYGTTTAYGQTATASQSPVTGNTTTNVSASITGLLQGTLYHFRVKAVSTAGTSLGGSDLTFTTPEPPVATTSTASPVANTTATLNGTVNAKNSSTTVTFEYGTTTAYGTTVTAGQSPVTGNSATPVTYDLTGLTPGETYHFRVKASSAGGQSDGLDQTFTTLQAPVSVTGTADNITSTGATFHGTINARNSSTTVTFEYGPTTSYGATVTATQSPITGNTVTNVSATVSGLDPSTTYHFRVMGISAGGSTGGEDKSLTTNAPPINSVLDVDGNLYNIVTIGNQKWITENLKVTKYNDGSDISLIANGSAWASASSGAYCWFNNDQTTYKNIWGALYNSYSVQTKKLCPTGWRVPYDIDWKILERYLGMSFSDLDLVFENRGTDQGHQLKSSTLWNGSNTTGFSAVEAGVRYNTGTFGGSLYTHFWTSDNYNPGNYIHRLLYAASSLIYRGYMDDNWGLSVRCIKSLPVVYDIKINSKTSSSANISATIIPDSEGNETTITVEYGTSTSYGNNAIATPSFISGFDKNPVIIDISGLLPETLYHFRINLSSSSGVISSEDFTFTTIATVSDVDGNTYNTVQIGTQIWMQENLKTTKYNDNSDITLVTDNATWGSLTSGGYCWYDFDEIANKNIYGAIYNYYTIRTQKLCPVGWHVPHESEWNVLVSFLGGSSSAYIKLKESGTSHWPDPNIGTNESGFTSIPSGLGPIFRGIGKTQYSCAYYWTDDDMGSWSYFRSIDNNMTTVYANYLGIGNGLSVRCIKD